MPWTAPRHIKVTEFVCNGHIPNITETSSGQPQQERNNYVVYKIHIMMENRCNIKANKTKATKWKAMHIPICWHKGQQKQAQENKKYIEASFYQPRIAGKADDCGITSQKSSHQWSFCYLSGSGWGLRIQFSAFQF